MTDSPVLDRAAGVVSELVPPPLRRHAVRGRRVALFVPAACFTAAEFAGSGRVAQVLTAVGLASTPVAVTVELANWSTLDIDERRRGVVHLAANAAASACFLTSFRLRLYGFGVSARVAGLLGLGALAADAYLTQVQDAPAPRSTRR